MTTSGTSIPSQRIVQKKISINFPQNMFKCSIHVRPTMNPEVEKYALVLSPSLRDIDVPFKTPSRSLHFIRPMNFLILNCMGSKSQDFRLNFKDLINLHKHDFVVLLETHRDNH